MLCPIGGAPNPGVILPRGPCARTRGQASSGSAGGGELPFARGALGRCAVWGRGAASPGSPAAQERVSWPLRCHQAPGAPRCAGRMQAGCLLAPDYHLVWSRGSGCNLMLSKLVFTRDMAAIRGSSCSPGESIFLSLPRVAAPCARHCPGRTEHPADTPERVRASRAAVLSGGVGAPTLGALVGQWVQTLWCSRHSGTACNGRVPSGARLLDRGCWEEGELAAPGTHQLPVDKSFHSRGSRAGQSSPRGFPMPLQPCNYRVLAGSAQATNLPGWGGGLASCPPPEP